MSFLYCYVGAIEFCLNAHRVSIFLVFLVFVCICVFFFDFACFLDVFLFIACFGDLRVESFVRDLPTLFVVLIFFFVNVFTYLRVKLFGRVLRRVFLMCSGLALVWGICA